MQPTRAFTAARMFTLPLGHAHRRAAVGRSSDWINRERVSSCDVEDEPRRFLHGLFG